MTHYKRKMLLYALGAFVVMALILIVFPLLSGTLYEDGSHSTLGCIYPPAGCTPPPVEFLILLFVPLYMGFIMGALITLSATEED